MTKRPLFSACRHFLRPIIRLLLRQGVTWPEFTHLAKDIYVDVARADYGIQGRPTNNSRVAMLTGLSRREVARVRDRILAEEISPDARRGNRISKLLTAWHTDEEFLDANGSPRLLSEEGKENSLARLFEKHAGDLPHVALQKEMLQRGLIEVVAGGKLKVLARDYVYSPADPEMVEQASVALHDHAATLDHNLNSERKGRQRFEGIADNARMSPAAAKRFARLIETRGMDFLQEMDAWLSGHEIEDSTGADDRTLRMGVGVYLIYNEIDERTDQ